jgi:CheY-like chemotaxis protein
MSEIEPVILYVEDDRISRGIINIVLTKTMGYEHVYVMSDKEWASKDPDLLDPKPTLVFLDIHMKVLDGYEIFKDLRARSSYKGVRIVALTASFMGDEVQRLKEVGFDGGIAKPINANVFPELVKRLAAGEEIWHKSS